MNEAAEAINVHPKDASSVSSGRDHMRALYIIIAGMAGPPLSLLFALLIVLRLSKVRKIIHLPKHLMTY